MSKDLQIFLCYRQVDGSKAAKWLYEKMTGQLIKVTDADQLEIKVYLDLASPAISDWRALHQPTLERARALLYVCSPGAFAKLGPQDWVHKELDWWLTHRITAPILIDVTGEGDRWIPESIKNRWPNCQRVPLLLDEWQRQPEEERQEIEAGVLSRILSGIRLSQTQITFEDLEREKALVRKLRTALYTAGIALLLALFGACGLFWFSKLATRNQKTASHNLALLTLERSERALLSHDSLGAMTLAAEAIDYDDSSEVQEWAMALSYWAREDLDNARSHFRRVLDNTQFQLEHQWSTRPMDTLAESISIRSKLENWVSLTSDGKEDAFSKLLGLTGVSTRIAAKLRADSRLVPSTQPILTRLQAAESDVTRLIYHGPPNSRSQRAWLDQYARSATTLSQALSSLAAHGRLSQVSSAAASYDTAALQRRLSDDQALVEYFSYHDQYSAWIVTNRAGPIRVELASAQEINSAAPSFANAVSSSRTLKRGWRSIVVNRDLHNPTQTLTESGNTLRRLIRQPIEIHLGEEISTIFIVPDASLASVPFAALPGRSPGSVLVDKLALIYLTDPNDLSRPAFDHKELSRALLIGGVDYARGRNPSTSFALAFSPLPGTQREVQEISKLLGASGSATQVLSGTEASEGNFRKVSPKANIIHLATHGWATQQLSIDSTLLKDGLTRASVTPYMVSLDPLLLSGVAFAGITGDASDGSDDGVLSAMEVRGLDLSEAQLVVLSACDTVALVRAGDSFEGMVRSFLDAGARTVVASTGLVNDEAAADFMTKFYRYLLDGYEPAKALRAAVIELRLAKAAPSDWAAFVIYGNTH